MMRGLIARGYSPIQAAALAGHALQESGGDPTNVNEKEGAHGLLQWRLDRWRNLQDFARSRGTDPTDPDTQLDFIGREFAGPEAAAGTAFARARDLPSASAALKSYIRFGDNSDQARLSNAQALLGEQANSQAAPVRTAAAAVPGASPSPAPGPDAPSVADALAATRRSVAQQDVTPPPIDLQPAQPMLTPQMIRARQLAQAMLSRSLNPGT